MGAVAKRTVRFFELTTLSGERFDEVVDVDAWLGSLHGRPEEQRVLSTRRGDYHARVWPKDRMVSLSIWRPSDDTPELVNRQTAEYQDLTLGADETFSETSHAVFFERNVVAFVRHHYGPFPSRLADYLEDRLRLEPPVALTPLLFASTMQRLRTDVDYARQLTVRLPAHAEEAISNPSLRGLFGGVRERYGEVDVTLTVQVNGGRRGDRNERGSDMVQHDLAELLTGSASRHLKAAKLDYRSAETERGEVIDFLKDHIAMAAEMSIEGLSAASAREPVRDAVRDAYDRLRPEVDAALG
jgi:hypothetical protein